VNKSGTDIIEIKKEMLLPYIQILKRRDVSYIQVGIGLYTVIYAMPDDIKLYLK
jgi:hypothetical protein